MVEVKEAVKTLKSIGSELTVWENRLEVAKVELQKTQQAHDALQAEIDKKSSDYSLYMAQRDAENKRAHSELIAKQEEFEKRQVEFQDILKNHQEARNALAAEKRDLDIQKLRHAQTEKNVQEFITAVRRASGLLGI